MMVHVGLANIGSDKVIERAEKAWTQANQMQVSVSIARTNDDQCGDLDEGIEDYCISMRRAAGRTAMVEVNVSCPNTHVVNRSPPHRRHLTDCSPHSTRSIARSQRWSRCR